MLWKKISIDYKKPYRLSRTSVYVDVVKKELGLVHKENGVKNMKFEFFNIKEKCTVDLDSLIKALQEAKRELLK